jgi:hypothetical protein
MESAEVRALQSHPPTRERIEHLDDNWKKLGRKTGFLEWDEVNGSVLP